MHLGEEGVWKKEDCHGVHDVKSVCFCILVQGHVVAAFEQSLSNMTRRLQKLMSTSEQKVLLSLMIILCNVWTNRIPQELHRICL